MTTSQLVRATEPSPPAPLPRVDRVRRRVDLARLRRFRRPLLAVLAVVVGAVVLIQVNDRVVGSIIHQQRQQRLAADFREPAPDRQVHPGEPIAVIQAATIGLNEVVVEGDTVDHLRGAPARRSDSALPGEPGRTVVLGHGRAYGGPFGDLGRLVAGDTVVVQTRNGGPVVAYVVRDVVIGATPDDIAAADDEVAQLVLVSSGGGFGTVDPVVVVASTLPVIDSPPRVGTTSFDASDHGAPFGVEALVANAAAVAVGLIWFGLRHRHRLAVMCAVTAPVAALAVVNYLMVLDTLLPSVR